MRFSWTLCGERLDTPDVHPRPSAYVRRPDDGAVPVGHHEVIAIGESIRAGLYGAKGRTMLARAAATASMSRPRDRILTGSKAFLALLEFFQQTEVSWDLCSHRFQLTESSSAAARMSATSGM
jgi:hypothetical protein